MRTIAGLPIPIEIHMKLTQRFGREYSQEHLILWLLEREADRERMSRRDLRPKVKTHEGKEL